MKKNIKNSESIIEESINKVWEKISPTWPLKNIIAINPVQCLEDIKFEEAIKNDIKFFKNKHSSQKLDRANFIMIKWCQLFFDEGQSTIKMPDRNNGFYASWKKLVIFDNQMHLGIKNKINFLKELPDDSLNACVAIIKKMSISDKKLNDLLLFSLTSILGWASYTKYLADWSSHKNQKIKYDFLAVRLTVIFIVFDYSINELLNLFKKNLKEPYLENHLKKIYQNEISYSKNLIETISKNLDFKSNQKNYDAQLVFCIDVRSELIRKSIESCGNYETFGFAGFFGVPVEINNNYSDESYSCCPVLLKPKYKVLENSILSESQITKQKNGFLTLIEIKKFYQSLKYNLITPLPLAEGMGIWCGIWMIIKTFMPKIKKLLQYKLKNCFKQNYQTLPQIDNISSSDQNQYALGFLRSIGLTNNFSKIILICGHGSQTENNSHASSLDCGACGGNHGDNNAKILAQILNQNNVRKYLKDNDINIPKETIFFATKHNTTTDDIKIYNYNHNHDKILIKLKMDLNHAKQLNNKIRAKNFNCKKTQIKFDNYFGTYPAEMRNQNLRKAECDSRCVALSQRDKSHYFFNKSNSWSEVRPEWGLAGNASFIIGPREITKNINLKGRSFLHSYDWQIDKNDEILNLIVNAPLIVAQWINSQYLFSTIDNINFGAGSKITHNVVGKIGVMQGNGSDLMHGLPLQSVNLNDDNNYHKPSRLITIIYAPKEKTLKVINKSKKVKNLILNDWIIFYNIDPIDKKAYLINNEMNLKVV